MDQQTAARYNQLTSMSPATSGLYPGSPQPQPQQSQINQMLPTAPMMQDRPMMQQQTNPHQESGQKLSECLMVIHQVAQASPEVNEELVMAARLMLQAMAKMGMAMSSEGSFNSLS